MSRAAVYLILCSIFWGWTFVATKVCLDYVTPLELIGLRFLIGVPLLRAVIALKGLKIEWQPQARKGVWAGSAIITLHFFIQITGLQYTTATNTGWIISVTPLVMVLLAYLFLREKLGLRGLVGIGAATVGIVLLVSEGRLSELGWLDSKGDWLVLASAHTWAIYTVVIRNATRAHNPLVVTYAVLWPAAVLVLGYVALTSDWSKITAMSGESIVALFYLGIFGQAIGHWFWQEGVSRVGAARAGLFLYLEPLATTALAVPFLGEEFGVVAALGGGLVLAGVFFARSKESKR